jgi:predicted deacylase
MTALFSKRLILVILVLLILLVGGFLFWGSFTRSVQEVTSNLSPKVLTIGQSVEGRNIQAHTFGMGAKNLVFVGGIHGGYEWNSVALAYRFVDYFTANPQVIPADLTVTVIPSINPDGLFAVTGKEGQFALSDVKNNLPIGTGRFNAHNVDLNRNFACQWQATSTWKGNLVSAGTSAFSEPEAVALKNFLTNKKVAAVVFWHSQANAVYASACGQGILPETLNLMNAYSLAADYPAIKTFDSYVVTGAAEDWLASINIPAITVELKTHETVEWEKNLAGVKALFDFLK